MKNKLITSLFLLSFSFYLTGCSNNKEKFDTITTETINSEEKLTDQQSEVLDISMEITAEEVVDVPVEETMEQKETVKEIIEKVPEEKNEEIQGIEKEEPPIQEVTSNEKTKEENYVQEQKEPEVENIELKPTFTVTKQDGTLYAKSSVNVRTSPSTDGEIINTLSLNNEVKQTGICDNGWVEILYNNQKAYVSGKYLSNEKTIINYTWDNSIKNVDTATDYTLSQISKYFLMVPENVRNELKEDGWIINVTSGNLGEIIYKEKKSVKAVTVFTKKEIWVDSRENSAKAIIHEMGHFIDDKLYFTTMGSEFNDIWEEEVEIFKSIHSTHDNNTNNPTEYFAEFFEVMILNPDIKKSCPKTYEFVSRCVEEIGTF